MLAGLNPNWNQQQEEGDPMNKIPSYPKILTLGSVYTESALEGIVTVQEKVDGSQFKWGITETGVLTMSSKSMELDLESPDKLFKPAVTHILKSNKAFKDYLNDTYFYGETLSKPKHNTLNYSKVPKNNIVLFEGISKGKFLSRTELLVAAEAFQVDLIPQLYIGLADIEKIKSLLITQSYLGGEILEGVVIKNYNQTLLLNGQIMPVFTKCVREGFKERHKVDWEAKSPKGNLNSFLKSFKSIPRWEKAIQFLKEKGELTQSPKDIGPLIKRIQKDVSEEETENIKNELLKVYLDDILRISIHGFPDFYKAKLLENVH